MHLPNDGFVPEAILYGAPNFVAVTPSDVTVLSNVRAIYVGGAGNLAVKNLAGTVVTFSAVPAGTTLYISPSAVMATGTTATLINALMA